MASAAIHDLDALRRYLGQEAPFLGAQAGRATGLDGLDRLLARGGAEGGLPKGALTLLGGTPGSGRASLAARVIAHETSSGRPAAWVDVKKTLYPPALAQAGVELDRLLLVRTDPERAFYAAEQLLESSELSTVVLSGLDRHLTPTRARRLQSAAESASTVGLIVADPTRLPALTSVALELRLARRDGGLMVTVARDRLGPSGRKAFVALPSEGRGSYRAA